MISHSEYSADKPLPYFESAPMATQIESYINQQEWLPVPGAKRRPRQSRDDLRRTKCTARYRERMIHGPVTVKQIRDGFHISTQAVKLKMREYLGLGYIKFDKNTNTYEWIAPLDK